MVLKVGVVIFTRLRGSSLKLWYCKVSRAVTKKHDIITEECVCTVVCVCV